MRSAFQDSASSNCLALNVSGFLCIAELDGVQASKLHFTGKEVAKVQLVNYHGLPKRHRNLEMPLDAPGSSIFLAGLSEALMVALKAKPFN